MSSTLENEKAIYVGTMIGNDRLDITKDPRATWEEVLLEVIKELKNKKK